MQTWVGPVVGVFGDDVPVDVDRVVFGDDELVDVDRVVLVVLTT
jgi:hypothetical protein